jgi:hypothetical protein
MTFDILVVIVVANVIAIVLIVQAIARKADKPEKLKKKFIGALLDNKPIVPKHERPKTIGFSWEDPRQFLNDFEDFADVVNWWLADPYVGGPWRLQELPDTELRIGNWDSPHVGRRFAVFHNQVSVGTLEVSPDYKYSSEKPTVRTDIELEWVRVFGFDDLYGFLETIALHVCDPRQETREYFQTRAYIDRAVARVLWQAQHISRYDLSPSYGELELSLSGSPTFYFDRQRAPAFAEQRSPRRR